MNRKDACGDRLALSKIYIGGKEFGSLPEETKSGQWYVIVPREPVSGDNIKVATGSFTFLQIADIRVMGVAHDDPHEQRNQEEKEDEKEEGLGFEFNQVPRDQAGKTKKDEETESESESSSCFR